jgi:hypothetical protein
VADVTIAGWRKSSRSSGGQQGSCVEVARGLPGAVAVRDSKDPHGPVLTLAPGAWRDLIADVKTVEK